MTNWHFPSDELTFCQQIVFPVLLFRCYCLVLFCWQNYFAGRMWRICFKNHCKIRNKIVKNCTDHQVPDIKRLSARTTSKKHPIYREKSVILLAECEGFVSKITVKFEIKSSKLYRSSGAWISDWISISSAWVPGPSKKHPIYREKSVTLFSTY